MKLGYRSPVSITMEPNNDGGAMSEIMMLVSTTPRALTRAMTRCAVEAKVSVPTAAL